MAKQNTSIFIQFIASLAITTALLAGCSNDPDRANPKAAEPDMIRIAAVDLAGEEFLSRTFLPTTADYILENPTYNEAGRCCQKMPSNYSIEKLGAPRTANDILEVMTPATTLYAITLSDPLETSLIEPLFGRKMRRHVMAEPQSGCEIVSGVRDGKLRVGVIAHEVSKIRKATGTIPEISSVGLDFKAIDLCVISAVLLLHDFPAEEAMDYAPYARNLNPDHITMVPDFKKIKVREAELRTARQD